MATGSSGRRQAKTEGEPQVTAASVAPLTGAAAAAPVEPKHPKPFLSEGMRVDIETLGYAVDPVSGARFELNRETGEVTVTEKDRINPDTGETVEGKVSTVDVVVNTPNVVTDPETGVSTATDPVTGVVTVTDPETGETRVTDPETGKTTVTDADGTTYEIDE